MNVDLYEKIWMYGVAVMLALFFGSTAMAAIGRNIHPPSHVETIDPKTALADPRFAKQGVTRGLDGKVDASVVGMLIAATIGSLVGAWILYGLSAAIGPVRLRAIVIRYGRWIGFGEDDLDRAESWFDRRARYAVLIGRCVPLIRSIISMALCS